MIKNFKDYIIKESNNSLPLIIMSVDKFCELLQGDKVYFGRKPLEHGKNIFTHDLIELSLGKEIEKSEYNYKAFVEMTKDDLPEILISIIKSPLNKIYSLLDIFMLRTPHKDIIFNIFSEYLNSQKNKNIKENHTFLNNKSSINKITLDDLEKLYNNESIIIDNVEIKNDNNIFLYDLILLSQGFTVDIDNIKIKLDDTNFKKIKNIIRNSPLNDQGSLFTMFIETYPKQKYKL